MQGYDLVNDLMDLNKRLSVAIDTMAKYGKEFATCERDYKITLREECLKLKSEGMAVTLIDKICYGVPAVADKRFKRDVAETMWKTAQENVNSIKLQIRIIDSQLSREWGKND